jgi:hypothetical protein
MTQGDDWLSSENFSNSLASLSKRLSNVLGPIYGLLGPVFVVGVFGKKIPFLSLGLFIHEIKRK